MSLIVLSNWIFTTASVASISWSFQNLYVDSGPPGHGHEDADNLKKNYENEDWKEILKKGHEKKDETKFDSVSSGQKRTNHDDPISSVNIKKAKTDAAERGNPYVSDQLKDNGVEIDDNDFLTEEERTKELEAYLDEARGDEEDFETQKPITSIKLVKKLDVQNQQIYKIIEDRVGLDTAGTKVHIIDDANFLVQSIDGRQVGAIAFLTKNSFKSYKDDRTRTQVYDMPDFSLKKKQLKLFSEDYDMSHLISFADLRSTQLDVDSTSSMHNLLLMLRGFNQRTFPGPEIGVRRVISNAKYGIKYVFARYSDTETKELGHDLEAAKEAKVSIASKFAIGALIETLDGKFESYFWTLEHKEISPSQALRKMSTIEEVENEFGVKVATNVKRESIKQITFEEFEDTDAFKKTIERIRQLAGYLDNSYPLDIQAGGEALAHFYGEKKSATLLSKYVTGREHFTKISPTSIRFWSGIKNIREKAEKDKHGYFKFIADHPNLYEQIQKLMAEELEEEHEPPLFEDLMPTFKDHFMRVVEQNDKDVDPEFKDRKNIGENYLALTLLDLVKKGIVTQDKIPPKYYLSVGGILESSIHSPYVRFCTLLLDKYYPYEKVVELVNKEAIHLSNPEIKGSDINSWKKQSDGIKRQLDAHPSQRILAIKKIHPELYNRLLLQTAKYIKTLKTEYEVMDLQPKITEIWADLSKNEGSLTVKAARDPNFITPLETILIIEELLTKEMIEREPKIIHSSSGQKKKQFQGSSIIPYSLCVGRDLTKFFSDNYIAKELSQQMLDDGAPTKMSANTVGNWRKRAGEWEDKMDEAPEGFFLDISQNAELFEEFKKELAKDLKTRKWNKPNERDLRQYLETARLIWKKLIGLKNASSITDANNPNYIRLERLAFIISDMVKTRKVSPRKAPQFFKYRHPSGKLIYYDIVI